MSDQIFDVVVIGGGAIGLGAAYETSKAQKSTLVLEKGYFYNSSGSSGDLARMFRTMYTEDFMAQLAHDAMEIWDELEKDAGDWKGPLKLRVMSGLLNFGNPDYGANGPEGTLNGPIPNLKKLGMKYEKLTKAQIEERFPFKNLPDTYEALWAPDNGVINVPLLLRTLHRLAKHHGAHLHSKTTVGKISPTFDKENFPTWTIETTKEDGSKITYVGRKIIVTCGAYVNEVLVPSFDFHLKLDIWEMVASYFSCNPGPEATDFPSMWFQFENNDPATEESRLFYGFPSLPWGPPDLVRIAVDAASNRIADPRKRRANLISPKDIETTMQFIQERVKGVDGTCAASSFTCLQTNVYDNMFVLDYVPAKYTPDTHKQSVAVFTAGWAMKFVPLLGRALKELVVDGHSQYALEQFKMDRHGEDPKDVLIVPGPVEETPSLLAMATSAVSSQKKQASGSSMRVRMGH